jgi:chlorobactene glucosyltransferase
MDVIAIVHFSVFFVLILSFFITISNLRFIKSLTEYYDHPSERYSRDLVSILIPARNEEDFIRECLEALSRQQYDPLEIIVLDDNSTDSTPQIIKSIETSDARIRMIDGVPAPDGWIGKQWACEQLYKEAKGKHLLFVDADTVLAQDTVSAAVYESRNRGIDLLTVIPQRIASCITERILYPFVDWAIFCWMPMTTAHKVRNPYLSATFGQFMFFTHDAYEKIGRHSAIKNNPLDDITLGRMIKKYGLKWMLMEGTRSVKVHAYPGNVETFKSLSRSIFPVFNYSITVFAMFSIVLLAVSFIPIYHLVSKFIISSGNMDINLISVLSVVLIAVSWSVVCLKYNHGMWMVVCYPVSIAVIWLVALHSMVSYIFHFTNWKNRKIIKQKIRV